MSLPIHTPPRADGEEQADGEPSTHQPQGGPLHLSIPLISCPVSRAAVPRTWAWSLPSASESISLWLLAAPVFLCGMLPEAPFPSLPPLHALPRRVRASPACSPMSEWMLPHPQPRPSPPGPRPLPEASYLTSSLGDHEHTSYSTVNLNSGEVCLSPLDPRVHQPVHTLGSHRLLILPRLCQVLRLRVSFEALLGTSLVVQWPGLRAPNAAGPGLIPAQGTRSCMLQLKILHDAKKIWCSQTNKYF